MYDAIVVGARCAGSPTAMLLARKGYRVLLLDHAAFPSDTMRSHFIHHPGVVSLHRWGLLPQVIASGCPPIRARLSDLGDFTLAIPAEVADGVDANYAPRRFVLDAILVAAAIAAGAELREHFAVHELVWDAGRVVGIRGRARGGAMVEERARIVVGADGAHSVVAKAVRAADLPRPPGALLRLLLLLQWRAARGDRGLPASRGMHAHQLSHERRPFLHRHPGADRGIPRLPRGHREELLPGHRARPAAGGAGARGQPRGALVRHGGLDELLPHAVRAAAGRSSATRDTTRTR